MRKIFKVRFAENNLVVFAANPTRKLFTLLCSFEELNTSQPASSEEKHFWPRIPRNPPTPDKLKNYDIKNGMNFVI